MFSVLAPDEPPLSTLDLPKYQDACDYARSASAGRDLQARYVAHLFDVSGTGFAGIRLGWGHFGEICYPTPIHGTSTNCYWVAAQLHSRPECRAVHHVDRLHV